jgi:hypothetical protein
LVVTPNRSLSGTVFDRLPWIIVGVGVLLALGAAAMTDRITRRRQQAEQLAGTLNRIAARTVSSTPSSAASLNRFSTRCCPRSCRRFLDWT